MDYNRGIFSFDGGEDDIAFYWMWTCLLDTSFKGRIELVLRILFRRPPRKVIDILDGWEAKSLTEQSTVEQKDKAR